MNQRLARIELIAAFVVALVIAVSGPGYRFGWWPLPTAFMMMRWGAWIAIALAVVAIVHLIARYRLSGPPGRGFAQGAAIAISLVAAAGPLWLTWIGSRVPPIHDITTDMTNPPAFVAIVPLRARGRNPVVYEGEEVARQQRAAYPDIQPLVLGTWPTEQAFDRALAVARKMGWMIIDTSLADGRIEASDTTPFFGFVDDIVIRVSIVGSRTQIDVRSLSRIGRSDLGANALRVRRYTHALLSELAEASGGTPR